MTEYQLKIVGVHYASNPEYVVGAECTEEMEEHTVDNLRRLALQRPRVVLIPEPGNPVDPNAVMARAMGRKIGYVTKSDLELAHRLLRCYGGNMLCAKITEVEVCRRGSLNIALEADDEKMEHIQVSLSTYDWSGWRCLVPSLELHDKWLACQEAEYVISSLLENPTPETRSELMEYMEVWIDNNLHDLSVDTKLLREYYMERLTALGDDALMPLVKRIDKQRTAICGDHRMSYRLAWWRELGASPQMEMYWTRWTSRRGFDLWRDLRDIDQQLRSLPCDAYDYVGKRSYLFARLSSLDIPRHILWNVYTLLLLRERICAELGIALKPLAPDAYWVYGQEEELVPKQSATPENPLPENPLPEVLLTNEARALHAKLSDAGMVDGEWQPVGLSNAEKGTLAEYLTERLNVPSKWKLWGALWRMNPETLRTSKARGLEQGKTWEFRRRLEVL